MNTAQKLHSLLFTSLSVSADLTAAQQEAV